jgi:hypothetical protein
MQGGTTIALEPKSGAGTERKPEASGGLSLYIPVPGMPIGGFAIDDDDTRARIGRGARVSISSSGSRRGDAETPWVAAHRWVL